MFKYYPNLGWQQCNMSINFRLATSHLVQFKELQQFIYIYVKMSKFGAEKLMDGPLS
jgi:hypothetical protein